MNVTRRMFRRRFVAHVYYFSRRSNPGMFALNHRRFKQRRPPMFGYNKAITAGF